MAVPNPLTKEFLKTYETVAPMVVPRSALRVTADDEYTLYAVTVFKKHGLEFVHKCREHRWTPRDFKHVEGGAEQERKEVDRVGRDERKLWGEALRLGRTGWGDAVMVWLHVLALRVFVETVLRYGLPLEYVCGLVKVSGHSPATLFPYFFTPPTSFFFYSSFVGILYSCLYIPVLLPLSILLSLLLSLPPFFLQVKLVNLKLIIHISRILASVTHTTG